MNSNSLESVKVTAAAGKPTHIGDLTLKEALTCVEYEGMHVPWWHHKKSAEAFRDMDVRSNDIVLVSGPKMGTTWVTKVLCSLVYSYDDEGNKIPGADVGTIPNRKGQVYPDACALDAEEAANDAKDPILCKVQKIFGEFTFQDMLEQPEPRLFSTHMHTKEHLPSQLFDSDGGRKGKGKMIVVLRNLKDTLCSLHFFHGEPKDGWDGNEHGPGSFERFLDPVCDTFPFGSSFNFVKSVDECAAAIGDERTLVLYYEALKEDLDAQLERINDFLELPKLTEAKKQAVSDACTMKSMMSDKLDKSAQRARKGIIGDWKNYLDEERWAKLDTKFDDELKGVKLAEPLRKY